MEREFLWYARVIEATKFKIIYHSNLLSLLKSKAVSYDLAAQVASVVFPNPVLVQLC